MNEDGLALRQADVGSARPTCRYITATESHTLVSHTRWSHTHARSPSFSAPSPAASLQDLTHSFTLTHTQIHTLTHTLSLTQHAHSLSLLTHPPTLTHTLSLFCWFSTLCARWKSRRFCSAPFGPFCAAASASSYMPRKKQQQARYSHIRSGHPSAASIFLYV